MRRGRSRAAGFGLERAARRADVVLDLVDRDSAIAPR